jgi:hypothetical protein
MGAQVPADRESLGEQLGAALAVFGKTGTSMIVENRDIHDGEGKGVSLTLHNFQPGKPGHP